LLHIMKQNETKLVPKSSKKFHCELCDYNTSRISQYNRHILTDKHKKNENETKMKQNETEGSEKFHKLKCICGLFFNNRTTMWRHKKKCQYKLDIDVCNDVNVAKEILPQTNKKYFKMYYN